jgi:hypothetical protein
MSCRQSKKVGKAHFFGTLAREASLGKEAGGIGQVGRRAGAYFANERFTCK